MAEKKDFQQEIEQLCNKDKRYSADAYEFVMHALHFTQKKLKREGHITGRELSEGLKDYAIGQYGPMSKTVLNHWGIFKTQDFGNIVFNMVQAGLLAKQPQDSIEDFREVYDFEGAFDNKVILRKGMRMELESG